MCQAQAQNYGNSKVQPKGHRNNCQAASRWSKMNSFFGKIEFKKYQFIVIFVYRYSTIAVMRVAVFARQKDLEGGGRSYDMKHGGSRKILNSPQQFFPKDCAVSDPSDPSVPSKTQGSPINGFQKF
jgi:hypothetical protein